MYPELSGVPVFPLILTAASVVGTAVFAWSARAHGLPVVRLLGAQCVIASAALLGSKVFALLVSGTSATSSNLVSMSGFRYPGAILAILLIVPVLRRLLPTGLGFAPWLDLQVPAICAALVVIRVGCLLEGCCYGIVTEAPWGLRFPPGSPAWMAHLDSGLIPVGRAASLAVHPLQLYFLLVNASIGVWAYRYLSRRTFPGEVALLFLVLHEGAKGALETLRASYVPVLQATELVVFVAAFVALVALRRMRAIPSKEVASA